jgi:hypothetical protein
VFYRFLAEPELPELPGWPPLPTLPVLPVLPALPEDVGFLAAFFIAFLEVEFFFINSF